VKARLIYNPAAGPWDIRNQLKRISALFKRHGWAIELHLTSKPGDATALARAAAAVGCDVAVVAGGDGTVNEAVNGLVGTETALGVLPIGTGNMWARQLGVATYTLANPLRLREAALGLIGGSFRRVDVGKANDKHFLCWAGIGLDAQVTGEIEPRPRHAKRLGALSYVVAAVLIARDFPGFRSRVTIDGSVTRGRTLSILISNIQQYCGFQVTREAHIDDGLLDVFVLEGLGLQYAVRHLLKLVSQRYLQDPRIVHKQARHIEVLTERATPVQVDGDLIGTTPVTVTVVPLGLRVLVPPGAPPGLFTATARTERPR